MLTPPAKASQGIPIMSQGHLAPSETTEPTQRLPQTTATSSTTNRWFETYPSVCGHQREPQALRPTRRLSNSFTSHYTLSDTQIFHHVINSSKAVFSATAMKEHPVLKSLMHIVIHTHANAKGLWIYGPPHTSHDSLPRFRGHNLSHGS